MDILDKLILYESSDEQYRGISQEEFSQRSDVPIATIKRIEEQTGQEDMLKAAGYRAERQ